jgi:hypothetical protein
MLYNFYSYMDSMSIYQCIWSFLLIRVKYSIVYLFCSKDKKI